jgi:cell division protease FtsH
MLMAELAVFLGGRAAEKAVFNELTTGAKADIDKATDIARKMVCEWGMSDELGPLSFGRKEEQIFLGREIAQHRDYSERTALHIDREVRKIVDTAEERAEKLIGDNLDKLKDLANALLEKEILDREEIDTVLRGEKLPPSQATPPEETEPPAETETVSETESAGKPGSPAKSGVLDDPPASGETPSSDADRQERA